MSPTGTIRAGRQRWRLTAPWQTLLLGPAGLRVREWLDAGLARVVKHGPHRTVYRVALPGLDVYVKHCRLNGLRGWLRQCLRPAKARLEFERARAVAARGVATVEPLAWGEDARLGPGDSYLVTRSRDRAVPLNLFLDQTLPTWPAERRDRLRQRLAVELGRFLARAHDAGLAHPDLHPGNLLLELGADDRPSFALIDLHAVRLGPPLGRRAGLANLVLLNRWFVLRAGRTDRLRCWRSYAAARATAGAARPDDARHLEAMTWESNLRFWRGRDARCRGTNRYFRRVGSAAAGFAVRGLDPATLAELLADPDAPFRRPDARLLKDSPSSTVAEVAGPDPETGQPRAWVYKRFRPPGRLGRWLALFRPTAALRSWSFGHGFLDRGLPTARPLLVLHRHRGRLPAEGYLLAEKVPDALDLHAYLDRLACLPAAERTLRLRAVVEQAARLVRELHRRRLSHRDLKAANLLRSGPPDAPRLVFIDLVGVTAPARWLLRRRQVQNLARLNASFDRQPLVNRALKLRFLRIYLEWGLRGKAGWKGWWRQIAAATARKCARNARRGRPLS